MRNSMSEPGWPQGGCAWWTESSSHHLLDHVGGHRFGLVLTARVVGILRGLLRERGCNHVGVACERDAHGVDGVAGEGFKRRGDLVLQLRAQLSQLGVSTRIDLRVDAHARVVLVRDVNLDVVRGQAVMALDDVLDRGCSS